MSLIILIEIIELGRTYFTRKVRKSEILSYFGREYMPVKTDKVNLKILYLLAENARMNSVQSELLPHSDTAPLCFSLYSTKQLLLTFLQRACKSEMAIYRGGYL